MTPYITLGSYHPDVWKCWKIGRDLTTITKNHDLVPFNDPVHPAQPWATWCSEKLHAECKRRTPRNKGGEDWHKDGDTTPGARMDCAIVLWSSKTPTEFQLEGKIYQPKPFEIVLFNNRSCSHRRPLNAPRKRFIFRQRVEIPKHIRLP